MFRSEEQYQKLFSTRIMPRIERWIETSLRQWNFRLSYKNLRNYYVIYDSPWCRVRFQLGEDQYEPEKDVVFVAYGRLQVPNQGDYLECEGLRF